MARGLTVLRVENLPQLMSERARIPCDTLHFSFGFRPDLIRDSNIARTIARAILNTKLMDARVLEITFRCFMHHVKPTSEEDEFWAVLISNAYPPNVENLILKNYPGDLPKTLAAIVSRASNLKSLCLHDTMQTFRAHTSTQLEAWQETGLREGDLIAFDLLMRNNSNTLRQVHITDWKFHHTLTDVKKKIDSHVYRPLTRCHWMCRLVLTKMHQWEWVNPFSAPLTISRKSERHYKCPRYNCFLPGRELHDTLTIGTTLSPIRRAFFPHRTQLKLLQDEELLQTAIHGRHHPAAVFAAIRLCGRIPGAVTADILTHPTAVRRSPVRRSRYPRVARPPPTPEQAARYINFFNNPNGPRTSLPITNHAWDTSSITYSIKADTITITTSRKMGADVNHDTPSLEDLLQLNTLPFSAATSLYLETRYLGPIEHHRNGPLCFFQQPPDDDISMNVFHRLYNHIIPTILSLKYGFQQNQLTADRIREDSFCAIILPKSAPILQELCLMGLTFNATTTLRLFRHCEFPNLEELYLTGPECALEVYDSEEAPSADTTLIRNIQLAIMGLPSLRRLKIKKMPIKTEQGQSIHSAFTPLINDLRSRPLVQLALFTAMAVPRTYNHRTYIPINTSCLRFWRKMKRAFDLNDLAWPPDMASIPPSLWLRLIRTLYTDYQCLRHLIIIPPISEKISGLTLPEWFSLVVTLGCDKIPLPEFPENERQHLLFFILQHKASQPFIQSAAVPLPFSLR